MIFLPHQQRTGKKYGYQMQHVKYNTISISLYVTALFVIAQSVLCGGTDIGGGDGEKLKITYHFTIADTLAPELYTNAQFVRDRKLLEGDPGDGEAGVVLLKGASNPYDGRMSLYMVEEVKGSALVVLNDGVPTRLYPGRDSTVFGSPSWTTVECLPEQYLKRWYKLPVSGAEDSRNKLLEPVATRASMIIKMWRSCNTNKINKIGAALTELLLAFGHKGATTGIIGKADKSNGVRGFSFRFEYSTDTFLHQRSMQCMARIEVDAKSQTLRININGEGASAMPGFEMFIGAAYLELSARVSPES